MRRPIAQQVKDIGIWYKILEGMTYIAVVFNVCVFFFTKNCNSQIFLIFQAFIIALTSDFIPRLVYLFKYSNDNSMKGYVNFTLAGMYVSKWGFSKTKSWVYKYLVVDLALIFFFFDGIFKGTFKGTFVGT